MLDTPLNSKRNIMSEYYEDAYYDPQQAAAEDQSTKHYVFKEGLRVRLPARGDDEQTVVHIMPAFADPTNPLSWQRYRDPNPPPPHKPYRFTSWIRPYDVWEYVGGKAHIIDPLSFNPESRSNPVKVLFDTIMSNPEWRYLAGKTPEGKKIEGKDAIKDRKIQGKTRKFVFNAVNPAKVAEREDNMACLYTVSKTAVAGGSGNANNWGLFAALEIPARPVDPNAAAEDYSKRYYWGDITDVAQNMPVRIYKEKPPTGSSMKLYNMEPMRNGTPRPIPCIDGRYPWLETRVPLRADFLFVDYDDKHVIDMLEDLFGGHPRILVKAFESTIPGYNETLLQRLGVTSHSTVHQPGTVLGPTGAALPPSSPPAPTGYAAPAQPPTTPPPAAASAVPAAAPVPATPAPQPYAPQPTAPPPAAAPAASVPAPAPAAPAPVAAAPAPVAAPPAAAPAPVPPPAAAPAAVEQAPPPVAATPPPPAAPAAASGGVNLDPSALAASLSAAAAAGGQALPPPPSPVQH